MAAHHAPKFSGAKICWKFSRLDFLGSRRHPLIDYLQKGQTINAEYYSSLLVQLKDVLKENPPWKTNRQDHTFLYYIHKVTAEQNTF
jgi:hypothetical protein